MQGIAQVSVADIMSSLGLTVGGFYKHFASKEALVAEAIEAASIQTTEGHEKTVRRDERASALLAMYLSDFHRIHAGDGCPVAALCSEVGHESKPTKAAFTTALRRLIGVVDEVVPKKVPSRCAAVLAASAEIVGALVLARATDDAELARELLKAVRNHLDARS